MLSITPSVSCNLCCIANNWETDNESVDSFTSLRDALIALKSKCAGNESAESAMQGEEGKRGVESRRKHHLVHERVGVSI